MSAKLTELLQKKKTAIIKQWFDIVIDTYPPDTSRFIKGQKDPFANPVGNTTFEGLQALFDGLFDDMNHEAVTSSLDPIIRIRAIQDFTASKAVSFIFSLKKIIRKIANKEFPENRAADELFLMDSKIDELGLIGFDIYMGCREKLYEIKSNEFRNRTFSAFERAGLLKEEVMI